MEESKGVRESNESLGCTECRVYWEALLCSKESGAGMLDDACAGLDVVLDVVLNAEGNGYDKWSGEMLKWSEWVHIHQLTALCGANYPIRPPGPELIPHTFLGRGPPKDSHVGLFDVEGLSVFSVVDDDEDYQ